MRRYILRLQRTYDSPNASVRIRQSSTTTANNNRGLEWSNSGYSSDRVDGGSRTRSVRLLRPEGALSNTWGCAKEWGCAPLHQTDITLLGRIPTSNVGI